MLPGTKRSEGNTLKKSIPLHKDMKKGAEMKVMDGICVADKSEEAVKIVTVTSLKEGRLLVTFQNGEERIFDTSVLNGKAFAPLKNKGIFESVSLFHGVLTWNNGEIDVAPEMVYENSVPVEA